MERFILLTVTMLLGEQMKIQKQVKYPLFRIGIKIRLLWDMTLRAKSHR
jgi:hypothetical protein